MYPNNMWAFGGGTLGGYGSPFPGLPGINTGPAPTGGGGYPPAPWWIQAGIYLGQETGFFDWLSGDVFGQDNGNGSSTSGYPTEVGGIAMDYVSSSLKDTLQPGSAHRQAVLQSYQDTPKIIQQFVDWLKSLGAVASLAQRMLTANIFEWPLILQDLILLFYHDQPAAEELAPAVIEEGNQQFGTLPVPGGQTGLNPYSSALMQYAPPVLPATPKVCYQAPRGYVVVTDPMTGAKGFMKKELAKAAGLYKPRAKAPIKASEWKAAKAAKRIEGKLSRMLKGSCNYKVTKKR